MVKATGFSIQAVNFLKDGVYSPQVSQKSCNLVFAETKYNMNKNAEIKCIGKPIFKQKINLICKAKTII